MLAVEDICWILETISRSSIVTNGQAKREILAVLLHVLCLSSEYICSLFLLKRCFLWPTISLIPFVPVWQFGDTAQSNTEIFWERSKATSSYSLDANSSLCCMSWGVLPLCSGVQSTWSCVQGWPPFPTALKQHCLTRLVNYTVATDALSMNNSR